MGMRLQAVCLSAIILLVLTPSSFVFAEQQNQTIPVYTFTNCNHSIINIVVTPLHEMYTQEYVLHECELINESKQLWECICEDSLEVTLKSLQGPPKTYVYTLVAVDNEDASLLEEPSIDSIESSTVVVEKVASNKSPLPAEIVVPQSKISFRNKLTGAVIGAENFSIAQWVIVFIVVLLLSLLINIRFLDMPWQNASQRAKRFHRHAKKLFDEGEHNRAKCYYAKAAKLREHKRYSK
ncbi:hypothetical protein K9M74_00300 [Candidatus Woesearchaeota archaeon]|nr:hypothetical protein [Candidatus Woesearchaeota archaeon]